MNPRCAVAITQAAAKLGRAVTRAELNNIEAKVRDMSKGVRAKDPARWQGLSAEDRMKEVGVALSDEFKSQAIRKATNASRDMVIAAKNEAYMDAAAARGITGFRSLMHKLGFIADGKGGAFNAEFRAKAIANGHLELMRPLIDMDKKGSFFGLFSSEKGTLDVLREYEGISTGNADARIAADSLRAAVESSMREFNAAGGDIRKLTNYRPQRQDQWKVYKAGRDKWVDDAMQNIDRRTLLDENGVMLDDAKARSFLQEAWWNLASDGLAKDRGGVGASAAISNRHKAHRQLNWKSPESFMAMQSKYGGGSFVDQVKGHIDGLAHETALMEQFGSNPLHQIDVLKEKAEKLDKANGVDINKTISERNRFETMTDKFAGIDQGITGNVLVHKAFSVMKNLNIANKLGSILTSQLADNGTAIATARALNIPLKEWASMKAKGYTDDQLKNMAKSNGIAFDVMIDNLVRLGDSTDATGISGKLAQLTMKVSGANMFTAMHRTAFASLVESHVGSLTRKYDWTTLPAKDKAILEGKGIGEQDWNIYRLADVDPESGLLGFSQINAVGTDAIKGVMPNEIAKIYQDAADFIKTLDDKNMKESGWLTNRQTKFDEYKTKIQKMIDDYAATREKRVEDYGATNLKRGGEMMARIDKAEIDMEIAKASVDALNNKRSGNFMDDVKRGIENYGRRRSEIGETLGAKRHSAKLQAYGADTAYTKLSEQLIAKKNELFGHERTEDGLVVIGELTKAVKELDAYTAKMEARIENAYKRNGDVKAGKEGTIERAKKLQEDAKIEYEAIRQSVEARMASLKDKVEGSQSELSGIIKAIEAKKNRAEAEADIASYLATEKSVDKVQSMLDTLDFRRDQTAERMTNEGERLGYKKAKAEARINAMAKREEAYAKTADKEVFSKATEFEKRIDKRMSELDEFTKSMTDKADERNTRASDYHAKIGNRIEKVAENARREAHLKLTAYALEEAETAVMHPSLHSNAIAPLHKGEILSELGGSVFQFKSFAIGFMNQHMYQRAEMMGGTVNQYAYRLNLLAMTTVLGGVGLLLGDIAQGKDPRKIFDSNSDDPLKPTAKFAMQAMLKGGGLSVYGDLLNLFTEEGQRDPIEHMTGPMFGQIAKTLKTGQEIRKASIGENSNVAKASLALAREFVPMNNLIWTRAVWNNYLMAELNEMASPGYMGRIKGIAEKNYGSDYYAGMGNGLRAPNFGNMAGQ